MRSKQSAFLPTRRVAAIALMVLLLMVVAAGSAGAAGVRQANRPTVGPPAAQPTDQVIIRFRAASDPAALTAREREEQTGRLSAAAGVRLAFVRPMAGGAFVYRLPAALEVTRVSEITRAVAALPEVEYAEPDYIFQLFDRPPAGARPALAPDDTDYGDQWHYVYSPGASEGLNLPPAWDITTGAADIVVAVLDTGILPHADLAGRTVPGYDFITSEFTAHDGDGRDSNPADPGDWVDFADLCGYSAPSSWHGTHVAGTIGAASNNGSDVAGVNWQARILPVRVLGRCGGDYSDISDAIHWAAGLPVAEAPPNPNPARVINLSLGGRAPCGSEMQASINAALSQGTVVVVAAGNAQEDASKFSPANCNGVVTVAATSRAGDMAWYSNFGAKIEVSAPGGETNISDANGVLSTLNDGLTVPGNDALAFYQGTSMAAPHVAGLVSLMVGLRPSLTPAEVTTILQDTARPFPNGSSCTPSLCGAGIVDAFNALSALQPQLDAPQLVAPEDGFVSADGLPVFEWNAVTGAEQYDIQVSRNAGFSAPLAIDEDTTQTTFTPAAPLSDGNYWWRVRARAGGDTGAWSEVRQFSVGEPPPPGEKVFLPGVLRN